MIIKKAIILGLFISLSVVSAMGEKMTYEDPTVCQGCHSEIYEQWNGSMHSNSWKDPVFQKLYEMSSNETGGLTDVFCARCHTPIGVINGEIPPADGSKLADISNKGIQCDFCHTVNASTGIGNGAYVSSPNKTKRGPYKDSGSPYHETSYSDLHTKSEFCGMCHDVTHPVNEKPIERTYTEWKESPYNTGDPKSTISCQDCHMRQKPGLPSTGATEKRDLPGKAASTGPSREHVYTHYFAGGNGLMPGILGVPDHNQLAIERLQNAAKVEIITPEKAMAGEDAIVQVKVTNTGAGHKLPTGLTEAREMWLDVSIKDAKGTEIYRSGALDKGGNVDPNAVIYRTVLGDAAGNPTLKVWAADHVISDNRIPPKGFSVEKYNFLLPGDVQGPLTIEAKLYYHTASQGLSDLLFGKATVDVPEIEMTKGSANMNVEPSGKTGSTPKSSGFGAILVMFSLVVIYIVRKW
jgi:hypothetical protein